MIAAVAELERNTICERVGPIAALENPKRFASFLCTVFRQDWVVYAKPAFGGPTQVLRYLGRYTHRVAISNHRLLAFDGEHVTFRWKDYAHGNKQRKMRLSATEFLRRFVQHVLPRGFIRIRQYSFLANRCRTVRLAHARQLLAATTKAPERYIETASDQAKRCPRCGTEMKIGPNLTGSQLAQESITGDSSPRRKLYPSGSVVASPGVASSTKVGSSIHRSVAPAASFKSSYRKCRGPTLLLLLGILLPRHSR